MEADTNKLSTVELCYGVLRNLNCEVRFEEESKGDMLFNYQSQEFKIIASDNTVIIEIWDFGWWSVSLDDLDEVSLVRKIINEINIRYDVSVVYSIDEEHGLLIVHSKRSCLFIKEIPAPEHYMSAMLGSFFEVQRLFHNLLIKAQNEKPKK